MMGFPQLDLLFCWSIRCWDSSWRFHESLLRMAVDFKSEDAQLFTHPLKMSSNININIIYIYIYYIYVYGQIDTYCIWYVLIIHIYIYISRCCPLFLHPPALGHLALAQDQIHECGMRQTMTKPTSYRPQFRAGEETNHDWLDLVGGLEHVLFSLIYGMSSFQLTNSIIFQRGRAQPPTRWNFQSWPSQMDQHFLHAAAGRFAPLPWGFALADHCRAGRLGAACSLWFSTLQGGEKKHQLRYMAANMAAPWKHGSVL